MAAVKHNGPFMGLMVQETAYHILMYVDIGSKTEYEELGRRMYAAYPFIKRPGTFPWVSRARLFRNQEYYRVVYWLLSTSPC